MMKVLVLYHSLYGHTERMAEAEAEGAREVAGTTAVVKRVPELLPDEAVRRLGGRLYQPAQIAEPEELVDYHAVIFGTPARLGAISGAMRAFLDRLPDHPGAPVLSGRIGSAFAANASPHGGNDGAFMILHATLLHLGMVIVGRPPIVAGVPGAPGADELAAANPYGATSLLEARGERMPNEGELAIARAQGRHVAALATRLHAAP